MTWLSLENVSERRVLKSYGVVASQVRAHLLEHEALRPTWVLSRKLFRRVLQAVLPEAHQPLQLARERNGAARVEKAARAYERVLGATSWVPQLELSSERCLVWSSPVTRPAGELLPEAFCVLDAPHEQLATAVCEVWAAIFVVVSQRAFGLPLKRLDVAVGVTEGSESAGEACQLVLQPALRRGREDRLPLPAESPPEKITEFDRSLRQRLVPPVLHAMESSRGARLTQLFRPAEPEGLIDCGLTEPRAAAYARISDLVVSDLLGRPEAFQERNPTLTWQEVPWMIQDALRGFLRVAEGSREVARLEALQDERYQWMQEVSLSLLPDDGLRRTLEEQLSVLETLSRLSARCAVLAGRLIREYSALSAVSPLDLDAGLVTPVVVMIRDFESVLAVARRDPGFPVDRDESVTWDSVDWRLAKGGHSASEDHRETLQALRRFVGGRPEIFDRSVPSTMHQLRAVVRRRLQLEGNMEFSGVDQCCETARALADQRVAQQEVRLPRAVSSRLAALRNLTCDAISLRERARYAEVRADYLLRQVVADVDRRLPRLDWGLEPGAAWHCRVGELIDAVDLRGTSLRARVLLRGRGGGRLWRGGQGMSSFPRFEEDPTPQPLPLSSARRLPDLLWLVSDPTRISYRGRLFDTLPSVARALGVRLQGACDADELS